MDDDRISCNDGCKRTVADEGEAMSSAWSFLAVTGRWRCPACYRELMAANNRPPQPEQPA